MTDWPNRAFWDELAGDAVLSIPEGRMICLQCGAEIDGDVATCPNCNGDPAAPLPLDCSDFTDDDWERV